MEKKSNYVKTNGSQRTKRIWISLGSPVKLYFLNHYVFAYVSSLDDLIIWYGKYLKTINYFFHFSSLHHLKPCKKMKKLSMNVKEKSSFKITF